jgi:hypothetical protein
MRAGGGPPPENFKMRFQFNPDGTSLAQTMILSCYVHEARGNLNAC